MRMLMTLAVGLAGGLAAMRLHIPAGALVGSLAAVGALRLAGAPVAEIPTGVRRAAQMIVGAMLGVSFGWGDLPVQRFLLPALLLTALLFSLSVAVAWIIVRTARWSWTAAVLSTAPAGMTELSLSADALGLDASAIAALHLIRITTVVLVVPWLVRWLT
ncbi:MAG: AbrB family transcriptional regulator [Armatimonadota bacterium]|nr:AbrB family transcriptional regulator [Armatimonadota bacterium]MDR7516322.1 AbrB family transcriptional regulator [Armatimonadota bacterium]MDR7560002.1 AbrB family transcriptional regulator [Armatimonadota bacterium]MDR7587640.1 AbrB family transcriptional regulator [Armatimonadota bacterium]MDR7611529.1 AbrB family transcriptional regulator [Armatimonadota bacterium]